TEEPLPQTDHRLSTISAGGAAAPVAVVTGGGRGIGAAIVRLLTEDGFAAASLDLVPASRAGVLDLECDIAADASVSSAIDRVRRELGPISVAVHCAAFQHLAPFDELDPADWSRSFRVNVDGAFHLVREVLPDLRAAAAGRVIVVT